MSTLTNVKVVLLKEAMDELYEQLKNGFPNLECTREDFHTIDCEYSMLSFDWIPWYNTGYKMMVEGFLMKHRHSICEVTEDGYNEVRYEIQDEQGCDEEFANFLAPSCNIDDSYLRDMGENTGEIQDCEIHTSMGVAKGKIEKWKGKIVVTSAALDEYMEKYSME